MMKHLLAALLSVFLCVSLASAQGVPSTGVGHSHTGSATITIAAPPTGQFVYITGIDISNCAGASAVTAAGPTYITTTNLTGAPQYQLGSGVTAGLCTATVSGVSLSSPLKSTTAATAVTFVLPAFATNQTVSVNVYYYVGSAR